jgi:hypothetical protein
VNFSKLSNPEKESRCHNLAKEIKMLKRKIRTIEGKLKKSGTLARTTEEE